MKLRTISASPAEMYKEILRAKKNKKKIVFTNGCFDVLHAGHVSYLEKARLLGDYLVIGLNTDASIRELKGPDRPIMKLNERRKLLLALRSVDAVIPFGSKTPLQLIKKIKPDVLVKGGDWAVKDIVGSDFVLSYGGKVVSGIYIKGRSTTAIIKAIQNSK